MIWSRVLKLPAPDKNSDSETDLSFDCDQLRCLLKLSPVLSAGFFGQVVSDCR